MEHNELAPRERSSPWQKALIFSAVLPASLSLVCFLHVILSAAPEDPSREWIAFTEGNHIWDVVTETITGGYRLWAATDGGVYIWEGGPPWVISCTLTTVDGLASNNVRSIAIDSQGNKWFATDHGVSLLIAGTRRIARSYTIADGLADNDIYVIAIDRQGHKWFGTESGLSLWITGTDQITSTCTGLYDCRVRAIAVDAEDNKWVGTWGGGVSFIPHGARQPSKTYTLRDRLLSNYVHAIAIDRNNLAWIGTLSGVNALRTGAAISSASYFTGTEILDIAVSPLNTKWLGTARNGVIAFSDRENRLAPPCTVNYPDNIQVRAITFTGADADSMYWVGTWGMGLKALSGWGHLPCPPITSTWESFVTSGLAHNDTRRILIDGNRKLIGTWGKGLSVYADGLWQVYDMAPGDPLTAALASNYVNDIAQEGNLRWIAMRPGWIGEEYMTGGASVWDDGGTPLWSGDDRWSAYLPSTWVEAIAVDPEGNKWLGTHSQGIAVLKDGGTPFFAGDDVWITYTAATTGNLDGSHVSSNWIRDIAILSLDAAGAGRQYWVCTLGGGVAVLSTTVPLSPTAAQTWFYYTTADGLASNDVWCMTVDQQGRKWFGTNRGISVLDDAGTDIKADDSWRTCQDCGPVRAIAFDAEGRAWCATEGNGIYVFDMNLELLGRYTVEDGLASNIVRDIGIEQSSTGAITTTVKWFATSHGLSRFIGAPPWPTPTATPTGTATPTASPSPTTTGTEVPTATPTSTPSTTPVTPYIYFPLIVRGID